jgi:cytoskeletal protein CcmA (bactofilin family)
MGDVKRGSDVSVLGSGARIDGILASSGSLQVYAHVGGELLVEGEVFVSAESVVEADIRAGSITLGGRARGNLTAPGDVSLSPGSQVQGDVHARNVAVHGFVTGDIVAQDRVELAQGARLDGNITCRLLLVAEGAVFCGRCTMAEHSKR